MNARSQKKETMLIGFGQCGVLNMNRFWQTIATEHGITWQGRVDPNRLDCDLFQTFGLFSNETSDGTLLPNTMLVDMDETTIDHISNGIMKSFYDDSQLYKGKESAAGCYAMGFYPAEQSIWRGVQRTFRRIREGCHSIERVICMNSACGGCGSGFKDRFFQEANLGCDLFEITCIPSPTFSTSIVEPYNAVLSTKFNETIFTLQYENEKLFERLESVKMPNITYNDLNDVISMNLSTLTTSLRYQSESECDFSHLQVALVPFPNLNFTMASHSMYHPKREIVNYVAGAYNANECAMHCFEKDNHMTDNPLMGAFIATALMFRGISSVGKVHRAIQRVDRFRNPEFVSWNKRGYKLGCCWQPVRFAEFSKLANPKISSMMICNNSSICHAFEKMQDKFSALYERRSFIHYYIENGIEEAEFDEALDGLADKKSLYEDMVSGE